MAELKDEDINYKRENLMDSQFKNIRSYIEIDKKLLQNENGQAMEVTFDQNR